MFRAYHVRYHEHRRVTTICQTQTRGRQAPVRSTWYEEAPQREMIHFLRLLGGFCRFKLQTPSVPTQSALGLHVHRYLRLWHNLAVACPVVIVCPLGRKDDECMCGHTPTRVLLCASFKCLGFSAESTQKWHTVASILHRRVAAEMIMASFAILFVAQRVAVCLV
ncbi:hypothetical protein IWX47DRAFT_623115 [Phyllosticta citricarpa]